MVRIGFAGFSVEISKEELAAIRRRASQDPLYRGACLIVDRQTGLALDSTLEPQHRTRPLLYTPHGAPWQQWRIERTDSSTVRIVSERNGAALTTDAQPGAGSWVWLEKPNDAAAQAWTLKPTQDSVGFIIRPLKSDLALDTGRDAENYTNPIVHRQHEEPWQQWLICRLPLS